MKKLITLLAFSLIANAAFAITYTSITSGSWNNPATWGVATVDDVPGTGTGHTGDIVIIGTGTTVTVTPSSSYPLSMTYSTWKFGGLTIQDGATLNYDNVFTFESSANTFLMLGTAKAIYNSTLSPPSNYFFFGVESFAATSTIEIKQWIGGSTPSAIPVISSNWGNLIINVATLGGNWDWAGQVTTISGSLTISATGGGTNVARLRTRGAATTTINIAGNLTVTGGILELCGGGTTGTAVTVLNVTGNTTVNGGILDLNNCSSATAILNDAGDFQGTSGTVRRTNGTTQVVQMTGTNKNLQMADGMIANPINFTIANGASVTLNGTTNLIGVAASGGPINIFGTLKTGANTLKYASAINITGGSAEINTGGSFLIVGTGGQSCTICNAGNATGSGGTPLSSFCSNTTPNTGQLLIDGGTFSLAKSSSSIFAVGSSAIPGKLTLKNAGALRWNGSSTGTGSFSMSGSTGNILDMDATSYIGDAANFTATAGTMKIGSPLGITATGDATGNIQVTGSKSYTNGTTTNLIFEYNGTSAQVTGSGFPSIAANSPQSLTLKVNNTSNVSLSTANTPGAFTGNSSLDLTAGKLILGSNNFNVTSGGTITNVTNSNYVVTDAAGQLIQTPMAGTAKIFPIGASTTSYDPLSIKPTNSVPFAVKVGSAFTNPPLDATKAASREYNITPTGATGTTALAFTPDAASYTSMATMGINVMGHYNTVTPAWEEFAATLASGTWTIPAYTGTFSPFGVGVKDAFTSTVLAVELKSLTAFGKGNANMVQWTTNTEANNSHFNIERSLDGTNNWTTIGTQKGKGNSSVESNYSFSDNNPLSISYYRLRSVATDGKEDVSKVVSVLRATGGKLAISRLFPSPASDKVSVDFEATSEGNINAVVTDMMGKVVNTQIINAVEGLNRLDLNVAALTSGVYILTFTDKTSVIAQRFVKN